jgi:MFS family permease
VAAGGLNLLFAATAALALAVAVWALLAVPAVPPLPRTRQTVADLVRRLADRSFLAPTAALAAATAALSVGIGFLPLAGTAAGLGPVATGAAVSVLAICAACAQPLAGRASDAGKIRSGKLLGLGLGFTAAGLAAAAVPGIAGLLAAAVAIGAGTGIITPVAFAALAAATPAERLGQTMGAAELGRELGDAGGPLLVGALATGAGLAAGYGALALLVAALAAFRISSPRRGPAGPGAGNNARHGTGPR